MTSDLPLLNEREHLSPGAYFAPAERQNKNSEVKLYEMLNVPLYVKVSELNKNGMTDTQEKVLHRISEIMIQRYEKQLSEYFAGLKRANNETKIGGNNEQRTFQSPEV